MWVRIVQERRFLLPENRKVSIHYKPGLTLSIRRAWGEALIASGDAVEVPTPARNQGT